MIPIIIQNGLPNIWDASDWLKVREESRIVGNLTGCLVGLPRQNTFQGLPLTLLKEEVTLLLEKNLAYVIDDEVLSKAPDDRAKEKFHSYKDNNKKQQMDCYESQRQKQITSMIDKIIEGKRRKLLGLNTKKRKLNSTENSTIEETSTDVSSQLELDREEILKTELNKSAENFAPPLLVHTFTREQWIDEVEFEKVSWNFPETPQEKLRYHTFKDLWEKGFYITEGHKFGVDFLVYPGDPVKFHAQFLVVCIDYNDSFSTVDLTSYARLGSISRKTFVIASQLPDDNAIIYQSIQWTEKN